MNFTVPGWTMDEDLRSFQELYPKPNEKISTQPDNELVELLWKNGGVVMQSQNNRKHQEITQTKPSPKNDLKPNVPIINPSTLIQEDEWLQYAMDDSLEKAFGCELFSDIPATSTLYSNKLNKEVMSPPKSIQMNSNLVNSESLNFPHFSMPTKEDMPPPKSTQMVSSLANSESINFSHFSRSSKSNTRLSNSVVGSSACGSNQIQYQSDVSCKMNITQDRSRGNTFNTTLTSSSGGSGCSYGKNSTQQSTGSLNHKRKERDAAESKCHGEEAEHESMEANKASQQTSSTRKSRAAEVHNLSERRRRDRINEKMRALQELIPHCNKSDKASMLDEAIEYLKSLQLQLQLMWMGSGMAPVLFPNIQQQYMSQISMPSINNQVQLSRNQTPMYSSPNTHPVNFSTQMQNAHMPVSYNRYLGYPHMQMPPQGMNLYTYGSNMVQLNQTPVVAVSNSLPTAVISSENIQNDHLGK